MRILIMNIILVGACGFLLFQDIIEFYPASIGRFAWTSNFYFNSLLNVFIVIFGTISILTQANSDRLLDKNRVGSSLRIINLVYGIFLTLIGIFFLTATLWYNYLNKVDFVSNEYFIFAIIMYCVHIFLIYLGYLIIVQALSKKKITIDNVDEMGILDEEI